MVDRGWKYYPALKLLLPFSFGIVLAHGFEPDPVIVLPVVAASLLWLVLSLVVNRVRMGLPLFLTCCTSGVLLCSVHNSSAVPVAPNHDLNRVEIIGRVCSQPRVYPNYVELIVACDSLSWRNTVVQWGGANILLRYYDSSCDARSYPSYGDHIAAQGMLSVPPLPLYPNERDYAAELRTHGIGLIMIGTRVSDILPLCTKDYSPADRIVMPLRAGARLFSERFVRGEEGDVVRALLIGEQEYVDAETRTSFTATGTIHILSVSGQHVGVIAMILFVLISWIPGRKLQLGVFAFLLMLYVLVAGSEPAIVRAAFMALLFMVARTTGRISRPLNILALAALTMLVTNPLVLFEAGFQLSFASVAGILVFYQPLVSAVEDRFPLLRTRMVARWLFRSFALTVSVQVFTLPLTLYYFGSVSLIAPLINLLVLPLTVVVLGASVVGSFSMLFSDTVASWFGGSAYIATRAMLEITHWGEQLPVSQMMIPKLSAVGAGVLLGLLVLTAMSRTFGQVILRMFCVAIAAYSVITYQSLLDPLRHIDESYVLYTSFRNRPVVTRVVNDSAIVYGCDARLTSEAVSGNRFQSMIKTIVHVRFLRFVNLDSIGAWGSEQTIHPVFGSNQEFMLTGLPVLLTTAQCPWLSQVPFENHCLLKLPMKTTFRQFIALRYTDHWERIECH